MLLVECRNKLAVAIDCNNFFGLRLESAHHTLVADSMHAEQRKRVPIGAPNQRFDRGPDG
jgi:hypothetical protein